MADPTTAKAFAKATPGRPDVVIPAWADPSLPAHPSDCDPKNAPTTPPLLANLPTTGPSASGFPDRYPSAPSLMALADLFSRSKRERIDPNILAHLPFGVRFVFRERRQISISETFVARHMRVFGYIASVELAESAGTLAPS